MGVDLNWGSQQPQNFAGGFIQSYEAGKTAGRQQRRDNALSAFAANPQDPNSVNALMAIDPESGMRLQQYQRQERVRSGLTQAYDPATGAIDPAKARSAYLAGGDVDGAMQFDAHAQQQKVAQIELLHKVNDYGLELLGGVNDQASYDQAKQAAQTVYQQYGIPFPNLPPVYNPNVVHALQMRSLSAKEQLEAARQAAQAAETARHNRATEVNADGRLALGQHAEARQAAKPQAGAAGAVSELSTADLLKIAGGN